MGIDVSKIFNYQGRGFPRVTSLENGQHIGIQENGAYEIWQLEEIPRKLGALNCGEGLEEVILNNDESLALALMGGDPHLQLWDLKTFELLGKLDFPEPDYHERNRIASSVSGESFLVAGEMELYEYDWKTLSLLRKVDLEEEPDIGIACISTQVNGSLLYIELFGESGNERIVLEQDENGEWREVWNWVRFLAQFNESETFRFSPCGKFIYSSFEYEPVVVKVKGMEIVYRQEEMEEKEAIPAFFHDDELFYWLDGDALMEMNTTDGSIRQILEGNDFILNFIWTHYGIYYFTKDEGTTRLLYHPFHT